MSSPTVGSLLAAIATLVSDGLRILKFADKRQWGPDEHEQLRLLEDTLDDAKKDFQELSVLVNGQRYYMNDRKRESTSPLTQFLIALCWLGSLVESLRSPALQRGEGGLCDCQPAPRQISLRASSRHAQLAMNEPLLTISPSSSVNSRVASFTVQD